LKIHVAIDIKKKKIVALDVTSEEVYDGSRLKELVDNALENNILKRVIEIRHMTVMKIFDIFLIRTLKLQSK
jgi:hypothetical protein